MDIVTALGLAASVAQLVEVSWKIVSKSQEIYKNGVLPEHRDTQTVTADLQMINNKLLAFLETAEKADNLSDDDMALRQLCESSNRIATELVQRLSTIKPNDEHRSWKSIRQALKSVWIKSELDETAARLQTYRTQLNSRILLSLRDRVESIDQGNKNIASSISNSRVLFSTTQEIQTDFLTRFITSQHEKTRELLASLTVVDTAIPTPGTRSPNLNPSEPKEAIFAAVEEKSISKLRHLLRKDPSAIFAFNATGQTPLHIAAGNGDIDMVAYLIRNGARINFDDDDGRIPLHNAVEAGSEPVVRALVAKGADIHAKDMAGRAPRDMCEPLSLISWIFSHGDRLEAKDETGATALFHFTIRGNIEAVRILLDQGADIETIGGRHRTPLFPACNSGFVDIVELLLARGASVKARDDRNGTALVTAGWHGHTRVGELLLDYGADINAVNQHKFSALHETCAVIKHKFNALHETCNRGRVEMAMMLLKRGARFEDPNEFGYTPLHQCAMHGHLDLVREILDRGGNINILHARAHWTALAQACEHGRLPVVELLLARGADVEEWTGADRKVALIRAAEYGYTEIVKAMLDQGKAKIDAADKWGKTSLSWAAVGGHTQTIKLLLSKHAFVGVQDLNKYTPLHRVAQKGHLSAAATLLDEGKANINMQNKDGWTPLAEACFHGHLDLVKLFLEKGAKKDIPTSKGNIPITLAKMEGRSQIVAFMEKHSQERDGWEVVGAP